MGRRAIADLTLTDSGLEELSVGLSCFCGLGHLNAFGRRRRTVGHCRSLSVAVRSKILASDSVSRRRSCAGSFLVVAGRDERSALVEAIFTKVSLPGSHGLQPNVGHRRSFYGVYSTRIY
jgi:hypothetical protein